MFLQILSGGVFLRHFALTSIVRNNDVSSSQMCEPARVAGDKQEARLMYMKSVKEICFEMKTSDACM